MTLNKNCVYLILLVLLGCKTSEDVPNSPLSEFSDKEYKISGQNIKLENDSVLYDPRTIEIYDTLAVCYDNNGQSAFTIVNLNSGKLVKRFGFTGKGNSKFNINSVTLHKNLNSDKEFSLLEISQPFRIFTYNIDSLLKVKTYEPRLFYQIPKLLNLSDILVVNDSMILAKTNFSKFDSKMYGLINIKQDNLIAAITMPVIADEKYKDFYSKENISWTKNVLGGNMAFRPGDTKVAYFSGKGALIQIFNFDDKFKFSTIYEKLFYLPDFSIIDHGEGVVRAKLTKDCKYGFNNITVTKNEIYALFNGKLTETDGSNSLVSNTVLVYDWNGKPLRKIQLDRDCYQISIDLKDPTTLYALSSFTNIGILKYKLPTVNE